VPAPTFTPIETTPAANSVAVAEPSAPASTPAPAVVSPPRTTDYFRRPMYYSAIDDSWAHGSLGGYEARFSANGGSLPPIADEWSHGVAVFVPTVTVEPAPDTVVSAETVVGIDAPSNSEPAVSVEAADQTPVAGSDADSSEQSQAAQLEPPVDA